MGWTDEDGNSLLHLAAWHGDVHLARSFFDSVKGRKLVTVANKKGSTPLAMAIIAGQVSQYSIVIEDFTTVLTKHLCKNFLIYVSFH